MYKIVYIRWILQDYSLNGENSCKTWSSSALILSVFTLGVRHCNYVAKTFSDLNGIIDWFQLILQWDALIGK